MWAKRWILAAAVVGVCLAAMTAISGVRRHAPDGPCTEQRFEGAAFMVCRFDARRQELRLASTDADGKTMRSLSALAQSLGQDRRRVRFAMNAGMFNAMGEPIGLYVERGQQRHALSLSDGPGNFHLMPNGVFYQDNGGGLHIDTSDAYAAHAEPVQWATQSGPMLVIDGALHPRFQQNGASRFVRNGVGVRDAHTAFFVISQGSVSFGRFARFFRDRLNCNNALFLDGAVSSLWAPSLNRMDGGLPIGPMIVALDG
jgi:uncharacterized protein YigE (DUF2233 family)